MTLRRNSNLLPLPASYTVKTSPITWEVGQITEEAAEPLRCNCPPHSPAAMSVPLGSAHRDQVGQSLKFTFFWGFLFLEHRVWFFF